MRTVIVWNPSPEMYHYLTIEGGSYLAIHQGIEALGAKHSVTLDIDTQEVLADTLVVTTKEMEDPNGEGSERTAHRQPAEAPVRPS